MYSSPAEKKAYQDKVKDLIERIKKHGKEYNYSDLHGYDDIFPGVKRVSRQSDCEGGGSHAEIVWHFKDLDVYIRVTGYYQSYNGTDWNDDVTQVFPKEKTVTVYEVEAPPPSVHSKEEGYGYD